MKKAYLSPKLSLSQMLNDDVILASVGSGAMAIGGDDWGVRDVF